MSKPLSIAQFTPFPWQEKGEINGYVDRLSRGLDADDFRPGTLGSQDITR